MNTDNWITLIGIIISAIIAFIVAKVTIIIEKRKGKLILLELIKKYLLNFNSSINVSTSSVKTDNVSIEKYIRLMEIIESEFNTLIDNPYYLDISYKYPKSVIMFQASISNEIAKLKITNMLELDIDTYNLMYELYCLLKKDMKSKYFKEGGEFFELNKMIVDWHVIFSKNQVRVIL